MTQTKKVTRAKVGPLPSSLAIAWPRETQGKLSPQDDDRRRGHDVSDLVISKKKRLSQDTDRSMLVGGHSVGHEMEIGRGLFNAAFGFSGYVEILGRFRV